MTRRLAPGLCGAPCRRTSKARFGQPAQRQFSKGDTVLVDVAADGKSLVFREAGTAVPARQSSRSKRLAKV